MPRFSVIMPTFKGAETIGRSIESVLRQSFEDWELIIVNDGSPDHTSEAVKPYLHDSRIQYLVQENKGVSAARNHGASFASSAVLVFMDSDDEVSPHWLSDFSELYGSREKVGYLSCGYILQGVEHKPQEGRSFSDTPYLTAPAGTFAVSKAVFDTVGGYDSLLRQSENWELAARVLTHCTLEDYSVVYTDNCNVIWHLTKTQTELKSRDLNRARAYLRLHQKYSKGGVLQHRAHRFLLGAAVNFLRVGEISESRKWFYRSFWEAPSFKAFLRLICLEVPYLRKKIWMNRKFVIEITEDM